MIIQKIKKEDFDAWLEMGLLLWPKHSKKELNKELLEIYKSKSQETFICKNKQNYVGFVTVALRKANVPKAKSYPVGYIEGIFVKKEYRKTGIAKKLISVAEKWLKSKGCKQVASDCELDNKVSQKFHTKLGFREVQIAIHYIKNI